MQLALKISTSVNLDEYGRLLWQHKISHQITQHENEHFVLVETGLEGQAKQLFEQWQSGQLKPRDDDSSELGSYLKVDAVETAFFRALVHAPLTLVLIIACILLLWLAPLASPTTWTNALMFPNFSYGTRMIVLSTVFSNFTLATFLKMLSPMLLHGGFLHLIFNMILLWELGHRIERAIGVVRYAGTLVVLALFSNTIQYLWGGHNLFGGMSGVNYGLFAYIWMWQLIDPEKKLNLPVSIIIYLLASLALFTYLGLSMIANAAHMGGFLTGIISGVAAAGWSRVRRSARRPAQ